MNLEGFLQEHPVGGLMRLYINEFRGHSGDKIAYISRMQPAERDVFRTFVEILSDAVLEKKLEEREVRDLLVADAAEYAVGHAHSGQSLSRTEVRSLFEAAKQEEGRRDCIEMIQKNMALAAQQYRNGEKWDWLVSTAKDKAKRYDDYPPAREALRNGYVHLRDVIQQVNSHTRRIRCVEDESYCSRAINFLDSGETLKLEGGFFKMT